MNKISVIFDLIADASTWISEAGDLSECDRDAAVASLAEISGICKTVDALGIFNEDNTASATTTLVTSIETEKETKPETKSETSVESIKGMLKNLKGKSTSSESIAIKEKPVQLIDTSTDSAINKLADEVEEAEKSWADDELPFPDIEQTDEEQLAIKGKRGKVNHEAVKKLRKQGLTMTEIARELGIKVTQVKYSLQYYKNR